MCTSTRLLLVEFLGTWIYLTLGGLGTLRTPYLPSVTWGVSLTAGYLLGGQESHLNPAVTLGLTAAGRSKLSALPGRLVGQFLGGYVAGMTLVGIAPVGVVERMIGDTNHTSLDWAEPWLTLPSYGSTMYLDILTFTLAAIMFQLLTCSCDGSALYQGISLAAVILMLGPEKGAGLNPAREIMGRLVVAFYHWNWDIFFYYDAWAWIPLVWSCAGCVTASLIHWILVLVPKQIHESRREAKKNIFRDEESSVGEVTCLMQEKPPSAAKLTYVVPPVPPPQPTYETSSASSTPPQLRTLFREKPTRNSAIQRYCKKNNISTTELDRYLERYQSVNLDKVDVGNGVTVKINDEEIDTDQKKELVDP